jgi:hypothetical protein
MNPNDFYQKKSQSLSTTMEQSPPCEANGCSSTQEILCLLWCPKVHYRVHTSLLLYPVLSQVIGYRLDYWGWIPERGRNFSLHHHPQTGSIKWVPETFKRDEVARTEADNSPLSAAHFAVLHTDTSASKFHTPFCYTVPIHKLFAINFHELPLNFCYWQICCIQKPNYTTHFVTGPLFQSSSHVQVTCTHNKQ